jgi:hypothetical protein
MGCSIRAAVRETPELPACNRKIGNFQTAELATNAQLARGGRQALQEGNLLGNTCDLLDGVQKDVMKVALVLDFDRVEGADHSKVTAALDCVLRGMSLQELSIVGVLAGDNVNHFLGGCAKAGRVTVSNDRLLKWPLKKPR